MAVSLQRFCAQIASIGLVTDAELQARSQDLADVDDGKRLEQLARRLVREKKLTAFQAQQLYAGKGTSLVLGNYLILDKLGQGGMGMVLKAMHRRMDRIVAIKILSPDVSMTPDAVKRFHREVKAAARLEHPNIVTAYDADESNGTHFLVMQYVEGTDFSSLVRDKGPLQVEQAAACLLQAARGLEYAHNRGIVHRDIKPANILLDHEGTVRILDMGLARIDAEDVQRSAQLTGTGQVMGTVDYMAPEQAVDSKSVDARADIYSLGVTLWYMLTGRSLYDGDTIVNKLMAHQTAAIPSLRKICPQVSPQLEQVFSKMVAKSPTARYQTVAEVIAELESCVATDLSTPSVSSQRSESSRFNSLIRQTRESSPVTEILTCPPVTRTRAESTPTIAVNSSEVGTDPKTIAPLVYVKPSGKIAAPKRRANAAPWVKYVAVGLLPLLLLAGVIVLIRHKDGTVTKIELPEGATAEIIDTPKDSPRMPAKGVGKVVPESRAATVVATLPPLAGYGSLVPRPAVIPGLKSWDIVRAMPAGPCFGAELLPDGRIVTAWNTPGIYVHSADLRVEQVFEPCESNGTQALAISEDGKCVAAYTQDHANSHHQLSVLELASGRSTPVPGAGWLGYPSLAFNRNRTMIAAGTGSGPKIFPLDESEPPLSVNAAADVKPRTVAWSPDESEIWTVDDANAFKAYRSTDLTPIPDHPLAKESVAWLNVDGTFRVPNLPTPNVRTRSVRSTVILADGSVRIYNADDWSIEKSWKLEAAGSVSDCKWSPDASRLAIAVGGHVEVWDVADASQVLRVKAEASKLVWHDEELLCFSHHHNSSRIRLDTSAVTPITFSDAAVVFGHYSRLSPDGSKLLCDGANRLAVFDAETGAMEWRTKPLGFNGAACSHDRSRIAGVMWRRGIDVFKADDQSRLITIPGDDAVWSPDDRLLAVWHNDGTVVVHDSTTGERKQQFKIAPGERNSMAWSPDGKYLAIRVVPKSTVHFWDTTTEKLVSIDAFPENHLEKDVPWIAPVWRTNEMVLVPFANQVFEVGPTSNKPVVRFRCNMVNGIDYDRTNDRSVVFGNSNIAVYDATGKKSLDVKQRLWGPLYWLPDGRRVVSSCNWFNDHPARGYDVDKQRPLGCCYPFIGDEGWLTIGPTGHYQGSEGIESEFLYVAEHDDGHQQTYTPAEFAKAFNWQNDPQQATFLKLVEMVEGK